MGETKKKYVNLSEVSKDGGSTPGVCVLLEASPTNIVMIYTLDIWG